MPPDLNLITRTKGFLEDAEGEHLYRLALQAAGKGPCLEIGSYCGKSTLWIGTACREAGQVLFAIDHHRGSEEQQPGEEYFDPALFDPAVGRIDTFRHFRGTLAAAGLEDTVVPVRAHFDVIVAFRDITQMPDWAGGAYDGKIRIPVGGLTTVQEAAGLLGILVHEMAHAFLHRMAPQGLPLWFNEGIATTFQGWDPVKIRAWLTQHPPEGLATLNDVDRGLRGRGASVDAAYAAARLAIAEMEDLRGFGAVRRIIGGVGQGRPFAEVFLEEMRLEVPEFEERWRKGLQ